MRISEPVRPAYGFGFHLLRKKKTTNKQKIIFSQKNNLEITCN